MTNRGEQFEQLKSVSKAAKPQLRPGSQVCQCAYCERYFTGVKAFDRHLVRAARGATVECLTESRMRSTGMLQNEHGVWQSGTTSRQRATDSAA